MVLPHNSPMDAPVDTPREVELKFEIEPPDLDRVRALILRQGADGGSKDLESVYYDTDDRRLRGAGLTLRVRRDGARRLQTVKTYDGAGLFDRGEWESAIEGDHPDLDAVGRTPAGEVLDGGLADLAPVFATRIHRTVRNLVTRAAEIELVLDEGEVDTGLTSAPLLEIELELKRGRPSVLFAAARRLSKGARLHLSLVGKAERGYGLADGDAGAAAPAAALDLPSDADAAEAFRRIGRSCLSQLAENARTLRQVRRPEALHQMRVALRRLRAAISMFKPVVDGPAANAVKTELKWITGELGDARNLDVFITGTFRPAADRDPDRHGMAELGAVLLTAQTQAYDRAVAAADSARFRALVLDAAAWIETGRWAAGKAARLPAREAAAEALTKLARRVDKGGRGLADLAPEQRHILRIDAKKLRYGVEFFAGLYPGGKAGRRREGLVKALKRMQVVLGELNDIAVARATALQAIGPLAGTEGHAAFAAGLVVGLRGPEARRRLKAAQKLHDRLSDAKPFW